MKERTRGIEVLAELYATARDVDPWAYPARIARGMLGGFLAAYDMVRVDPGLEVMFGKPGEVQELVHGWTGRLREEADKEDLGMEERVRYATGMLEAYRLLAGRGLVEHGLEMAWKITGGTAEGRLPCRGTRMCRLLQECFFFTGEKNYGRRAGELLREGLGGERRLTGKELLEWWDALEVQEGVEGETGMEETGEEHAAFWHEERERWLPVVEQVEESVLDGRERIERIDSFIDEQEGNKGIANLARVFGVAGRRARREVLENESGVLKLFQYYERNNPSGWFGNPVIPDHQGGEQAVIACL